MKKVIGIFSFLSVLLVLSTHHVSASEDNISEKLPEVQFRQTITLADFGITESIDDELLQEIIDASSITGWVYNEVEMLFERYVSYDSIEVSISDEPVIDNDLRRGFIDNVVTLVITDTETGETYSQTISNDSQDAVIVFDLDISEMIAMEDETTNESESTRASATNPIWSNGELGVKGYKVHCNRFNGYKGNGRYYSSNTSSQSLLNFYTSDCDWALGKSTKCLADYGKNPFCASAPASKNGSCSGLIGHSKTYHKHTTRTS